MSFTLTRTDASKDGVFGNIVSEDGTLTLATLEHAFEQPDTSWAPTIPIGTYPCERRLSPKFGYDLFLVTGVPGHDFIEIHIGNTNADSSGCILLGVRRDALMILGSKLAFGSFMAAQKGVNEFTLVIA